MAFRFQMGLQGRQGKIGLAGVPLRRKNECGFHNLQTLPSSRDLRGTDCINKVLIKKEYTTTSRGGNEQGLYLAGKRSSRLKELLLITTGRGPATRYEANVNDYIGLSKKWVKRASLPS